MAQGRVIRGWHTAAQAAEYRQSGLWGDRNLPEIFDEFAAADPEKVAVVDDQVKWTYGELRELSLRAARLLLELGVRPGDPVAVQLPSCALLPLVHLAANRLGAFMVAMPTRWRRSEVGSLLRTIEAEVLVGVESERGMDIRSLHEELLPGLPRLRHVTYARTGSASSFEERIRACPPLSGEEQKRLRLDPDQPAHVMCSSGTTGVPKASVWSGNDMVAMLVHQTGAALELTPADIAAGIAPAGQGSTGYIFPILMPLLYGATSVILENWTSEAALDLIVRERCTFATAIPTQMVMLLDLPLESVDLTRFTRFNNAGAPLPPRVAQEIERRMGCVVQNVYGTTDGGVPTMTTLRDPAWARWDTVGRPCAGEELELRGPDGERALAGVTGEVYWRGANNSYGYLNQPDYDAANWVDGGWYRSGDLGQITEDGYLRIVGRAKDMILRGGMNIFPFEVETVLVRHPGIASVAIVPVPDDRLGERACAVVVPSGEPPALADLTAFLTEQGLAKFKFPERMVLLDELPTNPGGKVDKVRLQSLVAELDGSE
ncbi:MAG: cyclohexanecarboxylate-CoA ligase [Pseudonocardiales bacterium]|jgi:non-ribosomal peptide synthetase component E (peptide arylation enzyme)|nr:cyclohexanecarboxylate-CoA ligase [Pseudonocardiales bacterium]